MSQPKDIAGQRFGRLTALHLAARRARAGRIWLCKCDCGATHEVATNSLCSGNTQSCGCLNDDMRKLRLPHGGKVIHGDARRGRLTPEYHSWSLMKGRCTNPNNKDWPHYGGRGIKCCQRWLDSFANFIEDVGRKPDASYSLDRINNDGNYEPANCRWATKKEQANNKRTTNRPTEAV